VNRGKSVSRKPKYQLLIDLPTQDELSALWQDYQPNSLETDSTNSHKRRDAERKHVRAKLGIEPLRSKYYDKLIAEIKRTGLYESANGKTGKEKTKSQNKAREGYINNYVDHITLIRHPERKSKKTLKPSN